MKNVLVLFTSENDSYIYDDIILQLEKSFSVTFEVISWNREFKRLEERIERDDFDFVLAGGGLAAHLPGLCASLTLKPVFGVPVSTNFGGLDAFLSILQMPLGNPVGTLAPNGVDSVAKLLSFVEKNKGREVTIVYGADVENHEFFNVEFNRLSLYANDLGYSLNKSHVIDDERVNIVFVHNEYKHSVTSNALYIPLLTDGDRNGPTSSLKVLDLAAQGGVWFGVNNSRNALAFLDKFMG